MSKEGRNTRLVGVHINVLEGERLSLIKNRSKNLDMNEEGKQ